MEKSEFVENAKSIENKNISVAELNKNNIMFNINPGRNSKFKSNLINFERRQIAFLKTDAEKQEIKEIKRQLKSKAFNVVAKMKHQKEVMLTTILEHETPNFNCVLKIQK